MGAGKDIIFTLVLSKILILTNLGILRNLYSTEVVQDHIMIRSRAESFFWDTALYHIMIQYRAESFFWDLLLL